MELPRAGQLTVISGPSGVGKTVLIEEVLDRYECERGVTATTRAPREGEVDGVDYYFYDRETFLAEVAQGLFLEHARVYENYYGTPLGPLNAQLERGATVLLNIDVQGATELMDRGVEARFVFIEPPSLEELARRLASRGTEDEEVTRLRLETARRELAGSTRYDHRIVNDDLEDTVTELARLLNLEKRT